LCEYLARHREIERLLTSGHFASELGLIAVFPHQLLALFDYILLRQGRVYTDGKSSRWQRRCGACDFLSYAVHPDQMGCLGHRPYARVDLAKLN